MDLKKQTIGGFDFSNFKRNSNLEDKGFQKPKVLKTGTTICGLIFKDGVVIGADTRATASAIVEDKNCSKIHYLCPNIYCCGAGTASDTEHVADMISSKLKLHGLNTGKKNRVVTAKNMIVQHLFPYQGHIGAYLVLGGVDIKGAHLYKIFAGGSASSVPFTAMGSGSLAAISVIESGFKKNLEEEEAKHLVHQAICSGIYNDLGSGSNVDLCVIKKDKTTYFRGYDTSNVRKYRKEYNIPIGTTKVLTEKIKLLKNNLIVTEEEVLSEDEEDEIEVEMLNKKDKMEIEEEK